MVGLVAGLLIGVTATSAGAVIAARLIMGISGGIASPPAIAFIQTLFPAEERPMAYGALGMVGAASYLAGQVLAGALMRFDPLGLGWRHAFTFGLVAGVIAVAAAVLLLPASKSRAAQKLDVLGAVLSASIALLLLYPLIRGASAGWDGATIAMLGAVPVLGALFVLHERRLTRTEGGPLVDLRLFAIPRFSRGLGAIVSLNTMSYAPFYVVTLTLQFGYHFTPLSTAIATAASPVGAVWGARLSAKRAHLPVSADFWLGAAMMAAGAATTLLLMWLAGASLRAEHLVVSMFVIGASTGLIGATATRMAMTNVSRDEAGSAASVLQSAQQFMMAVVIAAGGALFFALVHAHGETEYFAAAALTMTTFLAAAAVIAAIVRALPVR